MFVVDASVTMAWCFEDEATPETDAVLERLAMEDAAVPGLWPLEIANVLLVAERRGRVNEAQISRFVGLLGQLPIRVDPAATPMPELIAIGRSHGLSAYDAAYLALAEREAAALATTDRKLAAAARAAGVALLLD